MFIQWFPGHMTRAVRMMEEQVKLCDGIIYVLDSRAPYACLNKNNDKIFNNKPVLYLLNKADLVDNNELNKVISDFKIQNKRVISVIGTNEKSGKVLYNEIFESDLFPIGYRGIYIAYIVCDKVFNILYAIWQNDITMKLGRFILAA